MKHGWEIKKLGECFESIRNGANIKQERGATGIPITRIETLSGGVFNRDRLGYANIYTTDKLSSYVLEDGDLLLSHINSKNYIGRTVLYNRMNDEEIIHGMNLLRLKVIHTILSPFYAYYCFKSESFKNQIASYRKDAVNQSSIPVTDLKKINIPIPPLSIQERIVSELDCINGILEKKREQIKELDALAQSIFYDMFGDPIQNEKGWEVKKLGDVCTSQIGLTYKPENVTESEDGIIVLRSSNIQNSALDFDDIVRVDCQVKENKFVKDGDILMCSRNGSAKLVGKVARIKNLQEQMSYGAFMTIIRSEYNDYLFEFFKLPAFRSQLIASQTATINQITVKMLADVDVPLPPLPLQQAFATKIEAIEKQKELVKRSIAETETLLASRMQHYFSEE